MSQLYFHFVDFVDPPLFRERNSWGFTHTPDDPPCGYTLVNFGADERYLMIYVISDSIETANELLSAFMMKHRFRILPMTLDHTKSEVLTSHINLLIKTKHIANAITNWENSVDWKEIKAEINRKIQQNEKWNRKFIDLMEEIKKYEGSSQGNIVKILEKCEQLHVLPEARESRCSTVI